MRTSGDWTGSMDWGASSSSSFDSSGTAGKVDPGYPSFTSSSEESQNRGGRDCSHKLCQGIIW